MLAHVTSLEAGEFIHTFGDVHIYVNHVDQVKEQLGRTPYPLPKLRIDAGVKDLDSLEYKQIELVGYQFHPSIKGEVAV
jgi:thymidylate synthase